MGVSENSVPLNPMVNDHNESLSLLNGYFIGNIPYFQTNPYVFLYRNRQDWRSPPSSLEEVTAVFAKFGRLKTSPTVSSVPGRVPDRKRREVYQLNRKHPAKD